MNPGTGNRRSAGNHRSQLLPRMTESKHTRRNPQQHFRIKSLDSSLCGDASNPKGGAGQRLQLCLKLCALCREYLAADKLANLPIVLEEMEKHCSPLEEYEVAMWFLTMQSRVLLVLGEYQNSALASKKLKRAARLQEDLKTVTFCHRIAGESKLKLQQFEGALKSFFLMLQCSLQTGDLRAESKAYDFISTAYFGLHQMDRSEYFHRKFVDGQVADPGSDLRKMHRAKPARCSPQPDDSSDDGDLEVLQATYFEPLAADPKRKARAGTRPYPSLFVAAVGNGRRGLRECLDLGRPGLGGAPTTLPHARLTHLSANRSPRAFEAATRDNEPHCKPQFRLVKFGAAVSSPRKAEVFAHIEEFERRLSGCRPAVIGPGSDARAPRATN